MVSIEITAEVEWDDILEKIMTAAKDGEISGCSFGTDSADDDSDVCIIAWPFGIEDYFGYDPLGDRMSISLKDLLMRDIDFVENLEMDVHPHMDDCPLLPLRKLLTYLLAQIAEKCDAYKHKH